MDNCPLLNQQLQISFYSDINMKKFKEENYSSLLTIAMLQSRDLEEELIPDMLYQQYFAYELYTLPENELFKKSRMLEPAVKRVVSNEE